MLSLPDLAMRRLVRKAAPFGIALTLAACVYQSPPLSRLSVLPGKSKSLAAFQQDNAICQQHAVTHTGYNDLAPSSTTNPSNGTGPNGSATATAIDPEPPDSAGYLQCMASRGNTVQPEGTYAALPYPYGFSYGYADAFGYPVGYGYPYPFYDGGFYGGFGWGGRYGGGWGRRSYGHGGFARGGYGHGDFAHGGGSRGGGGHR